MPHTRQTSPGSSGRRFAIALAVTAALTTTSCNSASEPIPTATSHSAPSTNSATVLTSTSDAPTDTSTSTSTPTVTIPAGARERTRDGLILFLGFSVSEVSRAYREADPAILDRIFAPECLVCSEFRTELTEMERLGQHALEDIWFVDSTSIEAWSPESAESAEARVDVNQELVDLVDASGTRTKYGEKRLFRWRATLSYDHGWTITRLQRLDQ